MARSVATLCLVVFTLALVTVSARARGPLLDSLDVQITSIFEEVENSVFVSPLDPDVILVGNNRRAAEGLRVAFWASTDGGKTWQSNFDIPTEFSADPSAAISGNPAIVPGDPLYKGRFIAGYLNTLTKIAIRRRYKSLGGDSWTEAPAYFSAVGE